MSDPIPGSAAAPARGVEAGAALFAMGSVAAGFGVAACCALPAAFGALGLGGAWLLGVAYLAGPHRDVLLLAGLACLAGGAVLLRHRRAAAPACAPDGACASRPLFRHLTWGGLALGAALLAMGYALA